MKEEITNNELKAKVIERQKLKEQIGSDYLLPILTQWIEALKKQDDFNLQVNGKDCVVPQEALKTGKIKIEFEQNPDEIEFEIKLKWKPH